MTAQAITITSDGEMSRIPAHHPVSETTAMVSMIERAARDPSVDIEKMERLFLMQERMIERQAKAAYSAALSSMQPSLPVIAERGGIKDRAGNVQSTYALWEDINEAIKPVLAEYGFALSFRTGREDGAIVVTGILSHREGHTEETTMHLPIDASGSKNAVQAVGSSTSYGKRYTAQALLNLTSRAKEDRDDDGHAAGAPATITEEEVVKLQDLLIEVGANPQKFLAFIKVKSLSEIPAGDFEEVKKLIEAKRQKEAQA